MEQISNEKILKEISKEMLDLEAKIVKWNSQTDSLQVIDKWIDREKELICFRLEVVDAIRGY